MKLNACLTSDAWSNIKNEPIVNYMLISDSLTFFLESVSTGEQSHNVKWIAQDMGRMCDSLAGKLKHQPIHPKHPILTHQNHYYIHYYPALPHTIAEIRRQCSKYAFERTFQVWGKSKLACSYVQANHASSAKFLRSPALSTGQAIGASLLSLARCGGLWDYPRALKAGLLHPTATNLYQLGSPSLCILCHAHLDCKPMAPLGGRLHPPHCGFCSCRHTAAAGNQRHACANFDCTLHTTTTTTTTTTTPASPSFSTTSSNSNPDSTGTSAIWDNTRFEPPISVAHQEIPRQAQDTVEENPTASRTTNTDTHTAAISSTPTPTHLSHIGSDDILTVLLGGSLPGTNTAGNTEACPGQQWLTAQLQKAQLAENLSGLVQSVPTRRGSLKACFESLRKSEHVLHRTVSTRNFIQGTGEQKESQQKIHDIITDNWISYMAMQLGLHIARSSFVGKKMTAFKRTRVEELIFDYGSETEQSQQMGKKEEMYLQYTNFVIKANYNKDQKDVSLPDVGKGNQDYPAVLVGRRY
ncbi:hypothetical protein BASA60_005029 [Batrachochytrium salamandrivorans]|nr:hypothetical protein BASA60_005029 [Batrachochytrium salamandrivorans]